MQYLHTVRMADFIILRPPLRVDEVPLVLLLVELLLEPIVAHETEVIVSCLQLAPLQPTELKQRAATRTRIIEGVIEVHAVHYKCRATLYGF